MLSIVCSWSVQVFLFRLVMDVYVDCWIYCATVGVVCLWRDLLLYRFMCIAVCVVSQVHECWMGDLCGEQLGKCLFLRVVSDYLSKMINCIHCSDR